MYSVGPYPGSLMYFHLGKITAAQSSAQMEMLINSVQSLHSECKDWHTEI